MIRKSSKSRCNYLLSRETGDRVVGSYDFVFGGIRQTFSPSLETDTDLEFWRNPVFASYFCPQPASQSLLAAANEIGQVMLWDLKNDTYSHYNAVNKAHDNAIFDIAWSPTDLKIITASGDKSVVMWDCQPDLKIRKLNTFTGHTATAKTCAWSPDNPGVFCTGDRSGVLFAWDPRSGKPENRINNAHERAIAGLGKVGKKSHMESTSITGIVFYQPHYLITAAAGTEKIRMWDLRKYYAAYSRKPQPVAEISHKRFEDQSGYAYLSIDRARHKLYASTVCDRIYSFALNTPDIHPVAVFTEGVLRSCYYRSCHSPDGKYLLSGSSTECAVIWKASENMGSDVCPLRKVTTIGTEVNTVAWCKSGDQLKIVAFPESEPCQVFGINETSGPWDSKNEAILKQVALEAEVSEVESELTPTIRTNEHSPSSAYVSGSPSESEMPSPILEQRALSNLLRSAGHSRKRVLQEMLENDSEDRQNKKIKLRGRLSPRRLFISSAVNDENCESLSVSSRVTNRFDDKDSLASASSSELMSNSEDEEKNYSQFTASDSCGKTPFSPTSNLPNHVVDGTSPSHICKPYRKKRLDWLTELRHGKVSDLENNVPKKVIERNSCKNENSKKLHKKGHESILKFFRVLGKPTDEQLKSSPGCRLVSNNHSS